MQSNPGIDHKRKVQWQIIATGVRLRVGDVHGEASAQEAAARRTAVHVSVVVGELQAGGDQPAQVRSWCGRVVDLRVKMP